MSESGPDELGLYEVALLCGGRERVAQTALLALYEARRIRIGRGTRRVRVVRDESDDAVQAAVLAEIPDVGRLLGQVIAAAAKAPQTRAAGDGLRAAGLLRGGRLRPTRRGRALRRRLADEPGTSGPERLAALGPAGVEDAWIREILEAGDPKPIKLPRSRVRGHRYSGSTAGHYYGAEGAADGDGGGYDSGGFDSGGGGGGGGGF
ncbi:MULTISPECIES: TIGR04222 domain-containing membrane protein [unclassified Spirillospora]|uniref:TIGR04222 domain-containing membrane protein n=1 Tax=unclassified Spirillospora TaxID=2642701 RepID=UPI0037244A09